MSWGAAENVFIRILTDAGLVGWGDASPVRSIVGETQSTIVAAARELRPILLGKEPLALSSRIREMDAFLPHSSTAKSAFDMALYDIAAQAAGMPLYVFLGGERRPMETDMTIGIGEPAEAGERAAAIVADGFGIVKVKIGLDFADDRMRLANVRAAIGGKPIVRIDANQGWDRTQAIRNLRALEEFDIELCEQPCAGHDIRGLREISRSAGIPVMADESVFDVHDLLEIVRQDAAAYVNVKLSKSGGIYNAARIAAVAEAAGILCMIGCMSETKLGITAAAHFALSQPSIRFFDLDSHLEHAQDPIIGGVTTEKGMIDVPDTPGIGAHPDPAFVAGLQEIT
jgi:L-alanine-DL-glutamate epimerase-like enolase superfamily enzyme